MSHSLQCIFKIPVSLFKQLTKPFKASSPSFFCIQIFTMVQSAICIRSISPSESKYAEEGCKVINGAYRSEGLKY